MATDRSRSGDTPKASIVVPTRGGVERLPHLFEALRAQTETSWEAIVVVDGDTDNTAALLDEVRRELPVRPIVFPENRGRSAALNAGFAAARGDIFIRCDDDLRPRPNYVAGHIAQHEDGDVGAIGLYLNVYPDTPYARAYGRHRDQRFREEAYAIGARDRAWRYWAGNVSVRSDIYARVGEYDTNFRAYGWEDVDWGYRLTRAGVPIQLVSGLETPHHVAAVTTAIRVKRAFYAGAAKRLFEQKHGENALAESEPSTGAWNRIIDYTATRKGLDALLKCSHHTDARLDRIPRWAAEKSVSWLVESAALAGERHSEQVLNDV